MLFGYLSGAFISESFVLGAPSGGAKAVRRQLGAIMSYGSVSVDNKIARKRSSWRRWGSFVLPLGVLALLAYELWPSGAMEVPQSPYSKQRVFNPHNAKSSQIYHSDEFRNASLARYQGALRIPSEVYDVSGFPEEDLTGWEPFLELHDYFEQTYPLVHSMLDIHLVNKLGYIVIWNGTDPSLEPLLFTAHQDVIPVENSTLDQWTYPPYIAHFDGKRVWARGSGDTKNLVVGLFETFEELLKDGFVPSRTMIISLGYDEEAIGRYNGAKSLAAYLESLYGAKKFYAVIDEGGGMVEMNDVVVGAVGVCEKGYLDMYIELQTTGGHSSLPPDHTGIGIMSQLVVDLENDPFGHELTLENPFLDLLRLVGDRSETLDQKSKDLYLKSKYDTKSRKQLSASLSTSGYKYLQRTSQAIDIIHSGVKVNSLPELTKLGINHRISMELTAQELIDRVIDHTLDLAQEFELTVVLANGSTLIEGSQGLLNVSWVQPLDPSPVSTTLDSTWDILAGSIKHTFQDVVPLQDEIDVGPMIVGGYTDASRYWVLSDHVYRFIGQFGGGSNIHAINENFEFDAHVMTVCFLYDYILNVEKYGHIDSSKSV